MASALSPKDVARLLSEPSPELREELANKVADSLSGTELAPGEIALSDIALFDASADSLPRSIQDVLSRMLLSAELRGPSRVGVFFEMYGAAEQGEVEVTLAVAREGRPGFVQSTVARRRCSARQSSFVALPAVTGSGCAGPQTLWPRR